MSSSYFRSFMSASERALYDQVQKEKAGKDATRVITGYTPGRRIGGGGGNERSSREPIYAYIPKKPAPAAAPKPAAKTKPDPVAPIVPQISDASKQYRKETEKLLKDIEAQRKLYQDEQNAAESARRVAEEARIKREEIARETAITQAANLARQGKSAELQIKPTDSSDPAAAGTGKFKRRRQQFKIAKPSYAGLSLSKSKLVNI